MRPELGGVLLLGDRGLVDLESPGSAQGPSMRPGTPSPPHPRARPNVNDGDRNANDREVNAYPCSGCARFDRPFRELRYVGVRCDR